MSEYSDEWIKEQITKLIKEGRTHEAMSKILHIPLKAINKYVHLYSINKGENMKTVKKELDKIMGKIINEISNDSKKNFINIRICCNKLLCQMLNKESKLTFEFNNSILIYPEEKVNFCPFCGFEISKL